MLLSAFIGIFSLAFPTDTRADVTVYQDGFQNSWESWSWTSTINLSATTPVHGGANSVSVSSSAWGAFSTASPTSPVPAAQVEKVRFWMHGGSGPGNVNIVFSVQSNPTGGEDGSTVISAPPNTWTQFEVPLTSVGNPSQVARMNWFNNTNATLPTYYLDDITLVSPTGPPPPPPPPGSGPLLTVDAGTTWAISDDIYGMNFCAEPLADEISLPVNRRGGNAETRYNWKVDVSNRAFDYFFQNIVNPVANEAALPTGSAIDQAVEQDLRTGTKTMVTMPLIGWTPNPVRAKQWAFSIAKYGAQQQQDVWTPDSGNGITPGGALITWNDPHDTSVEITPLFVTEWIQHLQSRFGTANAGGVKLYSLDNEPDLWSSTHRDVRKTKLGYDEIRDRTYQYASAIKAADPGAKTLGPVSWGWTGFFYSDLDTAPGGSWWNNPLDRNAHGGTEFSAWYLQQMRQYELTTGTRILDYFDLHYYPQIAGIFSSSLGSATVQQARLSATRSLWDPTYIDGSWIDLPVKLVPRMRDWVANNYPGTKTCVSEYNFGALGFMNGALAQADALGIFGRERLDMATLWDPPTSSQPGAYAFRMFRNYDGTGKRFGETGVQAASADQSKLSVYAGRRAADHAMTVLILNKASQDLSTTLTLSNYTPAASAEVWRYTPANLNAIVRGSDHPVVVGQIPSITIPQQSMTLLVIPSLVTPVQVSRWGVE